MKKSRIVNLVLLVVVFFLGINLIWPMKSLTGNVYYEFDPEQAVCDYYYEGELHEIPWERCCFEIQKQVACSIAGSLKYDLWCYISQDSERFYLIDYKMYNYCEKEGYDVKIR